MSYIKGWNYALDRAIEEIKLYLQNDENANLVISRLKEMKVYAN